jgi:geranylgeranyl transferase type-1 subunit beta
MSCRSFDCERHIQYFSHSLRQLPDAYAKLDTNRLTLVHFCVHALDLLGAFETSVDPQQVINWIYSLEVVGGFCGGTYCGNQVYGYTHSHIAMTYTALATLIALGDDLSQVHKESIISSLRNLQRPNGSFQAVGEWARSVTCAFSTAPVPFRTCWMIGLE